MGRGAEGDLVYGSILTHRFLPSPKHMISIHRTLLTPNTINLAPADCPNRRAPPPDLHLSPDRVSAQRATHARCSCFRPTSPLRAGMSAPQLASPKLFPLREGGRVCREAYENDCTHHFSFLPSPDAKTSR